MPIIDDLPDLTHWKTVQEFSIEKAALLLAGIDPYDYRSGLNDILSCRPNRWKMALGLSEGIVSAIRRGVLTPIQCIGIIWIEEDNSWGHIVIKPTDRNHDIDKEKTIITRDSLFSWVENERVDFARHPVLIRNSLASHLELDLGAAHICTDTENVQKDCASQSLLALPNYNHKCEGLNFVDEAIKQFWSTYDEDDPTTAPKKSEIIDYLKKRGASNNLATAVDLVLRPFEVRRVGRRKSN